LVRFGALGSVGSVWPDSVSSDSKSPQRIFRRGEAEQGPTIAVRLQELFGFNVHPSIANGAVPLVLLSPAHRPVQVGRCFHILGMRG
jgi:HrpA-like RNA helicase